MDSEKIIFGFSRALRSLVAKLVRRYTGPNKDVLHQAEGHGCVKLD